MEDPFNTGLLKPTFEVGCFVSAGPYGPRVSLSHIEQFLVFYISHRCLNTEITSLEDTQKLAWVDLLTSGQGETLKRETWHRSRLLQCCLALLLFFTGADLAEAKEPVEETTDLASFLLNLELTSDLLEELLEETLPTEEKDLEEERSSSLSVAKPTTLTSSSMLRPT